MRIDKVPTGDNPPESLNVIIEVPTGGEPVKYEFDKDSGALFVDRILHTPMRYPANYGFVPHTLSPDGDPAPSAMARQANRPSKLQCERFRGSPRYGPFPPTAPPGSPRPSGPARFWRR